jgi:D-3-phosphoglycerate dehydrogenase / 2-oxoglutarate reductase
VAKPKVLLWEPIHQAGMDVLRQSTEPMMAGARDEDTIIREGHDAEGMILRALGTATARIMDACPRLKVIGRHGVGFDNIDVDAATERGIWVVNTPQAVTEPVAEHVVGMMIALVKDFRNCDIQTRSGNWSFRNQVQGINLVGKVLGIVGMGRIGYRLAEICGRGLGMEIVYSDAVPSARAEAELGARRLPLAELLAASDVVTLHCPYLPDTHYLICAETLALMKPTAYLINAARGKVVEQAALVEALRARRIAGAGLDVFEREPIDKDNPLLALDNVLLTPHVASSTAEALVGMSLVAEDIVAVLQGRRPEHPVNRPPQPRV